MLDFPQPGPNEPAGKVPKYPYCLTRRTKISHGSRLKSPARQDPPRPATRRRRQEEMREKKESGEWSPLSSIEDIQRRLVRPSQDSSFRYPIADPKRGDDRKTYESLTITQDSSYVRSELADRKFDVLKCLEKLAKAYPNSGDQITDLNSLEDRKRLLKSPTVDDLSVDDSALLIADFVAESFKEHQFNMLWESDDLISGSKPQEDTDERTITRTKGCLISDVESCKDVKRAESPKPKFGTFNDLIPDSELDPDEESKLLERLLNPPPFSCDAIAELKIEKPLKNSEKTLLIVEQVCDPGPCQHLKHLEEDGPNHQIVGDFVSDPHAPKEGGKPEKLRKRSRRGEEEMAKLEDYLHPSLLCAAASRMRKKMKKAMFAWPTEELQRLADSGGRAREVGDQRAGSDSSAFRRFDDVVLRLFHA